MVHRYLVGTESPPDILAVDEAGSVVSRPFKIPQYITTNAKDNIGFEAMTVARGGALFPHLYDVLPLDCVVAQHHLHLSASGDHILPENVFGHD